MFRRYGRRWEAVHPSAPAPSPDQAALDRLQSLLENSAAAAGGGSGGPRTRTEEENSGSELDVYLSAVRLLRGQFDFARAAAARREMDGADVFIWIYEVLDDFIPLLRVPTQEALAVFAHFCVLLKRLDFSCWLEGWAEHLMGQIGRLVDAEHRGWIDWAVEQVLGGRGAGGT